MTSAAPTVFVIDDDPAFCESLRWMVETAGLKVRSFRSAKDFLDDCRVPQPGCMVLDVRMPGMNGLELQQHIRSTGLRIPIILVTAYGDVRTAVTAMKAGAVDFLEKPCLTDELLAQIQYAIALDREQRRDLAQAVEFTTRFQSLTRREAEVMALVVKGHSSRTIAENLQISLKTVESHRSRIMSKMKARSISQLVHMHLHIEQFGDA